MAHIMAEVGIFGGNNTVDVAYDRPVRLRANCLAGIVYRGEVHPLYRGDVIQLDDESPERSLCPLLFDDGRTRISPTHQKLVQLARAAGRSTM